MRPFEFMPYGHNQFLTPTLSHLLLPTSSLPFPSFPKPSPHLPYHPRKSPPPPFPRLTLPSPSQLAQPFPIITHLFKVVERLENCVGVQTGLKRT